MFFFLSKTLDVLLSPLTWALVAMAVVAVALRRGRARLATAASATALLVLYLFSIDPVSNALTRAIEVPPAALRTGVTWDVVVVLGGVLDSSVAASTPASPGAPGFPAFPAFNDAAERLLAAFDLYRAGRASNVLLSSGARGAADTPPEARVLAEQLVAWGVPRDRLALEDRSLNTRENALYSAEIVRARGWTTVLVVTSAAHVPRAAGCFAAVGLPVDMLPVDFRAASTALGGSWFPRADALAASTRALREAAGRIVYRLRGWSTSE